LEGVAIANLGIFYDHLVYFTAIGNILWPYGIFVVIWYIFSRFGILDKEKSGNPAQKPFIEAQHEFLQTALFVLLFPFQNYHKSAETEFHIFCCSTETCRRPTEHWGQLYKTIYYT
jgi:hypothetical protein